MTDTYTPDSDDNVDDEYESDDEKRVPVSQVRHLAAKAKKVDDAEQRALAAERELAVYRSGLSLNDTQRQALLAVAGDNLDTDHLKSLAGNLFGGQEPKSEPSVPAEQLAGEDRVRAAMAGGEADNTDPLEFIKSASDAEFTRWLTESGHLPTQ